MKILMTKSNIENAIKHVDAIFALEGFTPSESIRATDRAVLAGVGSYAESAQELIEHVKRHKTVDGFVYSKTIAKCHQ
jgi:imidazoleglycerol phosphate synthase glutamine amidotransferase subunit HisH